MCKRTEHDQLEDGEKHRDPVQDNGLLQQQGQYNPEEIQGIEHIEER